MKRTINKIIRRVRRKRGIRKGMLGVSGRPRLSVFRSAKHIYAQLIDDVAGVTIASASSLDKEAGVQSGGNIDAATAVGTLIAKRAQEKGLTEIVFDRGGYLYHGRVKALAEAAREAGLQF